MAGGVKEHRPPTKRRGLLPSHCRRTECEAQRLGYALAISGVGLGAIGDIVFLDVPGGLADLTGGVVEFARDGGEAGEAWSFLADPRKDLGFGVALDVVRDGDGAVCAGALGVYAALGNHLACEMGELLDRPDVLRQCRPERPSGPDVKIDRDRRAGCMAVGGRLVSFGYRRSCNA